MHCERFTFLLLSIIMWWYCALSPLTLTRFIPLCSVNCSILFLRLCDLFCILFYYFHVYDFCDLVYLCSFTTISHSHLRLQPPTVRLFFSLLTALHWAIRFQTTCALSSNHVTPSDGRTLVKWIRLSTVCTRTTLISLHTLGAC